MSLPSEPPVDVYSAEGELLFAGTIHGIQYPWMRAMDEFVYSIKYDAETGETAVVRHRLVEPFD